MNFQLDVQSMRGTLGRNTVALAAVALAALAWPACLLHPGRHTDVATSITPGEQPDKILYQKALAEVDRGRYDVGRLTLQVLINTYPDSELLAKAKLLTADSYFRQGGISGLTQAELEYKDFITFFPTAPEAPDAEYRAGMCFFRLMGKPDRDLTEARSAQAEFKTFLEKYPDNSLVPTVKGRLREVDEVLAQGDFETAALYYKRGVNRAAASRFQEIADAYPDFSQADAALWYLGQSLERQRKGGEAATAYARLLTDYPLSPDVKEAKGRLSAMHKPIPRPTKATLARARADREVARRIHHTLLADFFSEFSGAPDLSATRHGPVHLGPYPASGAEQAKAQPPSAVGTITAQPMPDSSTEAGAAASPAGSTAAPPPGSNAAQPPAGAGEAAATTPKEAGGTSGAALGASPAAAAAKSAKDPDPDDSPAPKKKGKFHFLKKLFPF
ncbi:MAG TPA: outer membrane protein assembly factor BamD [Terriglobia bacterium]|nr:outer membrane protein assembly factor BamD [Terriglobia bacterium]